MKTALQVKLSQHLTLTPQLQQAIKLLQLSTVELEQEIERYISENPLLERLDGETESLPSIPPSTEMAGAASADAYDNAAANTASNESTNSDSLTTSTESDSEFNAEFANEHSTGGIERSRDDESDIFESQPTPEKSLQQHLLDQLAFLALSRRDRQLATLVIAQLDDDGYLSATIDEMCGMCEGAIEDLEPEELGIAIRHVQQLDPAGVGARSLSECLELQLRSQCQGATTAIAIQIVREHLQLLASRDFAGLKRALRIRDEELKAAQLLITSLDPKPGRRFTQADIRYVVPDVVVRRVNGRWQAALNREAVPKLRINRLYADLVQKSRDSDGKNLSGQLQEARWLLKNIQQRFDTILRVTQAIVENQRHFFDHGEVAMRPLVLRDIADQVGLHESTVSRVTTQKYMLTPRGLYELKYFFGSSVSTDTGGSASATAIRAMIKKLVDAEDHRKPLSDNKIADLLNDQGIIVARRTIAKYRESLQIQPASQRKTL